jgi:hypothetical protein
MEHQKQFLKRGEAMDFVAHVHNSRQGFNMRLPQNANQEQPDSIAQLRHAYYQDSLVLVLGAGISLEVGLPSWDTLLNRLLAKTIDDEGPLASDFFAKVFNSLFRPNSLVLGRYLQQFYEAKGIPFSEVVRRTLYSDYKKQTFSNTSKVLREIVRFCIAPGRGPNLNSIITYNYDDVVEQLLRNSDMDIPFRSIFRLGENPALRELAIYHVHGYLPMESDDLDLPEITFGENVYHKQYSDTYSWNNMVQINKFRDNACLFIGSSLTDPNIRRLLDIARAQRGKDSPLHYVIKKRHLNKDVEPQLLKLLEENELLQDQKLAAMLDQTDVTEFLCDVINSFEESDAQSLGMGVIWVEDYDEIPKVLSQIRGASHDTPKRVTR